MIIGIHQPNFFPWLGFFDKINKSDIFVFLDHVHNNPRDSLWTKRVKIIANKAEYWLTVPIERPKKVVSLPVKEMKISSHQGQFREKHLKNITHSYEKTKFFAEVFPFIEDFYNDHSEYISNRNYNFIVKICHELGIKKEIIISSNYSWEKTSTELLIDIITKLNGTSYLCGGGAGGYQDDNLFIENRINLVYQKFNHPIYQQSNSNKFIEGLSIIDSLMNIGFSGVKKILNIT